MHAVCEIYARDIPAWTLQIQAAFPAMGLIFRPIPDDGECGNIALCCHTREDAGVLFDWILTLPEN